MRLCSLRILSSWKVGRGCLALPVEVEVRLRRNEWFLLVFVEGDAEASLWRTSTGDGCLFYVGGGVTRNTVSVNQSINVEDSFIMSELGFERKDEWKEMEQRR